MEVFKFNSVRFFDTFHGDYSNKIFKSKVKRFSFETKATLLSIKSAIRLPEKYIGDGKDYIIQAGEYCVLNPKKKVVSDVNSKDFVEGISIFLDYALVSEVYAHLQQKRLIAEPLIYSTSSIPFFYEKSTPFQADCLGLFLKQLWRMQEDTLRSKWVFYQITERLLLSQKDHLKNISLIPAVKPATKTELYHRLELAKSYIHDCIESALQVRELARLCWMTEYNFIRLFRLVYGITPYQYILEQKNHKSQNILEKRPIYDSRNRRKIRLCRPFYLWKKFF